MGDERMLRERRQFVLPGITKSDVCTIVSLAVALFVICGFIPASGSDPRPAMSPSWAPIPEDTSSTRERLHVYAAETYDSTLRSYRASLPESFQHRAAVLLLDQACRFNSANVSSGIEDALKRRLDAVAYELEHTTVTSGAVTWKIYNHGFIVRTPTATLAFDLVPTWFAPDAAISTYVTRIIVQCDALFVSNNTADHADSGVISAFLTQSKPVIAPSSVFSGDARLVRLTRDGLTLQTVNLSGGRQIQVIMFPGHRGSAENNVPMVVVDGMRYMHTGEQDSSSDFGWINAVKTTHDVDFLMANCGGYQSYKLVQGVDPRVVFPGHENEMLQVDTARLGFFWSMDRFRTINYPVSVMGWGDSFYYEPGVTYTTGFVPQLGAPVPIPDDPRPVQPSPPGLSTADPEQVYGFTDYNERQRQHTYFIADSWFRRCHPQSPEPPGRKAALLAIDQAVSWGDCDRAAMPDYYNRRVQLMLNEMDAVKDFDGMMIWRFWNICYIVRTRSMTFCYDMVPWYLSQDTMRALISRCDAMFFTHTAEDHNDQWTRDEFVRQGKKVIGFGDYPRDGTTVRSLRLANGKDLKFVVFPGYQGSDTVSIFYAITPEGYTFCHTSDLNECNGSYWTWNWLNNFKQNWPLDVLAINNWLCESTTVLQAFNPKAAVIAHDCEIYNHEGGGVKPYSQSYEKYKSVMGQYPVMVTNWGESYYYRRAEETNEPPTIVDSSISSSSLDPDNLTQYTVTLRAQDPNGVSDIRSMRCMLHNGGVWASENGRVYLCWGATDDDVKHWGSTWTTADAVGGGRWGWYSSGWGSDIYTTPVSTTTSVSGNERTVTWAVTVKPAWVPAADQRLRAFAHDSLIAHTGWIETPASYSIRALPAITIVSGPTLTGLTTSSATINWTTSAASNSAVAYGTTASYGQSKADAAAVASHSLNLTGLTPATTYHYSVSSAAVGLTPAASGDSTFATLTPPTVQIVSGPTITNVTQSSATVSWTTDPAGNSIVDYGTTTSYGQSRTDAATATQHTVTLSGLQAGTAYHCRARTQTSGYYDAISGDLTFTTQAGLPALANPGFEAGTGQTAWTRYGVFDAAGSPVTTGPILSGILPRTGSYMAASVGSYSTKNGGLFQRLTGLQTGQFWLLSAWLYTYNQGSDYRQTNCRVAIDPDGGTSPTGAGLVWSDRMSTQNAWAMASVAAVANGSAITVFLEAQQQSAVQWNVNCFDDCELTLYPTGTIAEALGLPSGANFGLIDKVVTAGTNEFSGAFYVQEDDRSAGIRVASSAAVNRGDRVSVAGKLGLTASGERQLTAESVRVVSAAAQGSAIEDLGRGDADPHAAARPLGSFGSRK